MAVIISAATNQTNEASLPALSTAAGEGAIIRSMEFFAVNIRKPRTRRAYMRAVTDFLA